MNIRDLGEFGLIARTKDRLPTLPPSVVKGIGDAAAASSPLPGNPFVTTVDLAGFHFDFSFQTPDFPGRKSPAAKISDIATGTAPRQKKIPDRGRRWK